MSSETKHDSGCKIAIIGGGIIGCSIAYYITRHPSFSSSGSSVAIFESHSVAAGASGKAGGLVATWAFPRALAAVSFAEHLRLAEEHNGSSKWGWRYTNCGQWEGRGADKEDADAEGVPLSKSNVVLLPKDLDWIQADLTSFYTTISSEGDSAQVHPRQFTLSMSELAQEGGAKLITGDVTKINISSGGSRSVEGITFLDSSGVENVYSATHVVHAADPWSPKLIPSLPIYGTRAHSIVIRPPRELSAYALFTEIAMPSSSSGPSAVVQPEIYTRPNNEVYVAAAGDEEALPPSVGEVKVEDRLCDELFEQAAAISPDLRRGEIIAKQACYRPNVNFRGSPILGEVKDVKGLIVASGHTCWVCLIL